jgi:SAM-dependent methyltransferase
MSDLPREAGRSAFGGDAANYDSARPGYPSRLFEILRERCGLAKGTRTLEIGPGTGQATRALMQYGADPLIEPDARLAAKLAERASGVSVIIASFEDACLPADSFDLCVAATSFHWMEQRKALAKVAAVLRSGGSWAMWWNVFGDPTREDAFDDATQNLLSVLAASPSWNRYWKHPFALDCDARLADLAAIEAFADFRFERIDWTLVLDAARLRALYATFSQIATLEAEVRNRLLDGVQEIAAKDFANRVERRMVTAIYTARRR